MFMQEGENDAGKDEKTIKIPFDRLAEVEDTCGRNGNRYVLVRLCVKCGQR